MWPEKTSGRILRSPDSGLAEQVEGGGDILDEDAQVAVHLELFPNRAAVAGLSRGLIAAWYALVTRCGSLLVRNRRSAALTSIQTSVPPPRRERVRAASMQARTVQVSAATSDVSRSSSRSAPASVSNRFRQSSGLRSRVRA